MASYSTNEFRSGLKVLLEGDPCSILENEFVKPGKGQAFNRVKFRNLKSGRVWERTFKSGESIEAADVMDLDMEYLYSDGEFWHFMRTDGSYEQVAAAAAAVGDAKDWLKEQDVCQVTLWNDDPPHCCGAAQLRRTGSDRNGSGAERRYRQRWHQTGNAVHRCGGQGGAFVRQHRRRSEDRYAYRGIRQSRPLSARSRRPHDRLAPSRRHRDPGRAVGTAQGDASLLRSPWRDRGDDPDAGRVHSHGPGCGGHRSAWIRIPADFPGIFHETAARRGHAGLLSAWCGIPRRRVRASAQPGIHHAGVVSLGL